MRHAGILSRGIAAVSSLESFGRCCAMLPPSITKHPRIKPLLWRAGYSDLMRELVLLLTDSCDSHCEACSLPKNRGGNTAASPYPGIHCLPRESWFRIVDHIRPYDPLVIIFGGEPLMVPYACDLARHIKSKGFRCAVMTNGSLLQERAGELVGYGLDHLVVSLDGREEVHDASRGLKGSFKQVIAGMEEIDRHKRAANTPLPRLQTITTINRTTYRHLEETVALAQRLPLDEIAIHHLTFISAQALRAQRALFRERTGEPQHDFLSGYLYDASRIDGDYVRDALGRIRASHHRIPVVVRPPVSDEDIPRYYRDPEFTPSNLGPTCYAPRVSAIVGVDGNVIPCLGFVVGNLISTPLAAIYNNARFRFFRNLLSERIFPFCARCCHVYCYRDMAALHGRG